MLDHVLAKLPLGGSGARRRCPTPAHAVVITEETRDLTLSVILTDCSPTAQAGKACRAFVINGEFKTATGVITNQTQLTAYTAISEGDDTISPSAVSGSDVETGAKIKISNKGKSWTVDVTNTLVCGAPGCPISGKYRFRFTLTKAADSSYQYESGGGEFRSGPCLYRESETRLGLANFKGTGTAKGNGATKAVRVYREASSPYNVVQGEVDVVKKTAGCPALTVDAGNQ